MILIAALGLFTFLSLYIIGVAIQNLFQQIWSNETDTDFWNSSTHFFVGLITTGVLCGWLSLFVAINTPVLYVFIALVMVLAFVFKQQLTAHSIHFYNSLSSAVYRPVFLLFCITMAMMFLDFSFMGIIEYDTGLYHSQAIKWIRSMAAVPGLGNLHDRLAFNSMAFPISALFTFFPNQLLIYSLNYTAAAVLIIHLTSLSIQAYKHQKFKDVLLFALIAASFLFFEVRSFYSASTDVLATVLILFLLVVVWQNRNAQKVGTAWLAVVTALIFFGITVKISLLFAALILLLYLPKIRKTHILAGFIVGGLVLAPFFIRNYILSGYLIFPFGDLDIFNPDWKVPADMVQNTMYDIKAWARIPRLNSEIVLAMPILEWLPRWWNSIDVRDQILMAINVISIPVWLGYIFRKRMFEVMFQGIILLNIVFWFFNAPDPRFALGFLFMNAALTFRFFIPNKVQIRRNVLLLLVATASLAWVGREYTVIGAGAKEASLWVTPRSSVRHPDVETLHTNFKYFVPTRNNQCFDSDIPCTPYPKENLLMRKNTLEHGFRMGDE